MNSSVNVSRQPRTPLSAVLADRFAAVSYECTILVDLIRSRRMVGHARWTLCGQILWGECAGTRHTPAARARGTPRVRGSAAAGRSEAYWRGRDRPDRQSTRSPVASGGPRQTSVKGPKLSRYMAF